MATLIELNGVGKFDPNAEPSQLNQAWKRWHRSFELFAVGKGVSDAEQKKALLLHCAGPEVQDIFYTLNVEQAGDNDNVYTLAVKTLDKHFENKVNVPYERYVFRKILQTESETVEQFITKLRQQAVYCDFTNQDEQIRDQVIEKCRSHKIRAKLLEKGKDLTLEQLRTIAATFEMTETQARHMDTEIVASVNRIQGHREKTDKQKHRFQDKKCFRCGREGHFAKDVSCPARNKECRKCGKVGHFIKCCLTKKPGKGKPTKGGKINKVDYSEVDSDSEVYVFSLKTGHTSSDKVKVSLGGNPVEFVIDSGASANIIDKELWEYLKKNRIKCHSEKCEKKLFAYGSTEPLKLLGKFRAQTSIHENGNSREEEFFVLNGTGPALLGKDTAMNLGVLKLGVNTVQPTDFIHEYSECFRGIGKLKDFKLKLHIDKNVKPVAQSMYRIPYSLRDKVGEQLDELESQDIIERVNDPTPWVSPVIIVPKPNGDIRLCVDMRQANAAIIRERHPIPTVDDILYMVNGSQVFSKLDLRSGYHQIELEELSREITTFVTYKGLYRYKRLMFGISSAPEKYQQVISQVFHDCEGVQNISDDIVIYGRDKAEHDERLRKALQRLKDKGLTLNLNKCEFRMNKITFMGHVLSKNGIGPTSERIKSLLNAKEPTNGSEVKSFLGLVNFSARYIPNLATVAEPLRRLTKKNVKFVWSAEQKKSFDTLKSCLSNVKTLGHYRLDAEKTQLVTDASNVGLGAVLLQVNKGETRVISYASRTLSAAERNYSTIEKEALAVVWACEKFHIYLYGVDFELVTDHKPLEVIYGRKSRPNARIERWLLKLMAYNFKVRYSPGHQNIADALSRLVDKTPVENSNSKDTEQYVKFIAREATPQALSTQEVEEASRRDEELVRIRKFIKEGKWEKSCVDYYPFRDELCCIGYVVLRGSRIVIPRNLRKQCVQLAHQGHLGIVGTKQQLRTKVWWPGMDKEVEKYVKSCHGCQITSAFPKPEPVSPTPLPTGPWQELGIDILGPLTSGQYVLVVVDYYSRYYEIEVTKDITSEKIIDLLEGMFCRHGLPLQITSDNGPQFRSKLFKDYLTDNCIKHRAVTPLHPSANGEVERQNRSLMKRIRIAQAESKNWKTEIRKYLFAYRTTPHTTTGVPPAELMFRRKLRTKLPQVENLQENDYDEGVRDKDAYSKYRNKIYIDEKRDAQECDLELGDSVLLKKATKDKMDTPYHVEPYTLVQKTGNSCVVKSPEGVLVKRNSEFVKKYQEPESVSDIPENPSDLSEPSVESSANSDDVPSAAPVTPSVRRSTRIRKLPQRLKDFEL
ncbi:uncharacterized protein K02A2.6-like [Saccostrea cucullata]|uniref:uncharacterized protein K02A2.6-like n=2 Tax=Saccostrea cuccullata TaxID=36930 RepID=UPI002ED3AC8C